MTLNTAICFHGMFVTNRRTIIGSLTHQGASHIGWLLCKGLEMGHEVTREELELTQELLEEWDRLGYGWKDRVVWRRLTRGLEPACD